MGVGPKCDANVQLRPASLIVGDAWSVWHYWRVLTPAGRPLSEFTSSSFLTWWAYELANSVLMAWLYNNTGCSLPIAWAAHAGLTLGQNLVDAHPIPFGWFVLTFWAAAASVVLWHQFRTARRQSASKSRMARR